MPTTRERSTACSAAGKGQPGRTATVAGDGEGHTWQTGNNMVASGSLEVEVECNTNKPVGV